MIVRAKIAADLGAVCLAAIGCLVGGGEVKAGVLSYTCDPNVDASTCTFLNTTIASLYDSTFTNVAADIYIKYGTTGLGETDQNTGFVSYSKYVTALNAESGAAVGPVRTAALASLPASEPPLYAGGEISITSALAQALGISAGIDGTQADGAPCSLGVSGCYNAIVTLTNSPNTFYYRNRPQPSTEYDFYSLVELETDKVLGMSSCIDTTGLSLANGCGGSSPSVADLFRYSAAGTRSLLGTNTAYFSYDGGETNVAYYTHTANGQGFGDFDSSLYNCVHVQDAEGCLGGSLC